MINWTGFVPGVGGGDFPALRELLPDFNFRDQQEFLKAVTAGFGTDHATLVGGGALRRESLEGTLLKTIQDNEHFKLFNKLAKTEAGATVDEFSIKRRIGGFPGSAFNSELGDIPESQGDYERKVVLMKFLMTRREVSQVQVSQKTLIDTIADQTVDATLELLTSAEWACFYGDADVNPVEFDGLRKIVEAEGNVIDVRGNSLSSMAAEVQEAAAQASGYGRWGRLTDYFCSHLVQSDLDKKLDPALRVALSQNPQQVALGAPVRGIATSWGDIAANPDPFVIESPPPFVARGVEFTANVASAGVSAPQAVSVAAASDASSQFATGQDGNYYYAVEGMNNLGRSGLVKSAQVAVAAGDKVTISITESAGGNETGYVIYRSRRNGTNADADFREIGRVAKAGSGTTAFTDLNATIPGTSEMFLVTNRDMAITFRRLLPMTRFPLYPTTKATHPWAQLLFGALRVGKPNQHFIIKNILPSGATWRPF